jgi:hypothetical protein
VRIPDLFLWEKKKIPEKWQGNTVISVCCAKQAFFPF